MRHVWVTAGFCAGMTGVAMFQIAAALGAPVGEFTQGGRTPGVLPPLQRAGAAASAAVCLGFVVAALDHAGAVDLMPDRASHTAMTAAAAFLALNTVANAASTSPAERQVMTPISLALTALAAYAALHRQ